MSAHTHVSVQIVTMSSLNLRDTSVELIWQSALLSLTNNHLLLSMVIFTWLLDHGQGMTRCMMSSGWIISTNN